MSVTDSQTVQKVAKLEPKPSHLVFTLLLSTFVLFSFHQDCCWLCRWTQPNCTQYSLQFKIKLKAEKWNPAQVVRKSIINYCFNSGTVNLGKQILGLGLSNRHLFSHSSEGEKVRIKCQPYLLSWEGLLAFR